MDIVSVLHLQEKRLQIAYNHVNKVRMEVESCRRAGYSGMNTLDSEQIDWLTQSIGHGLTKHLMRYEVTVRGIR